MFRHSRRAVPKRWHSTRSRRPSAAPPSTRCVLLNFATHCGPHPSNTVWPDGKYTVFRRTDYPRIRDYPSGAYVMFNSVHLFQHLARKKLELNEEMQTECLDILRSGVANNPRWEPLQVVKIIEGFAKGNTSISVRKEMDATIAWLKGLTDHYGMKFKAAALHRFEKALQSMAAPVAAPNGPASSAEVRRRDGAAGCASPARRLWAPRRIADWRRRG